MIKKPVEKNDDVREGRKEGRQEGSRKTRSSKCTFERDDEGGRLKKVTSSKSKGKSRGKDGRKVDDCETKAALLRLVKNHEFRVDL